MSCNRTRICGRIVHRGALRYTPAGVPVLRFVLLHRSEQDEGGQARRVECEVPAVAFGAVAETLSRWPAGAGVGCEGYLARTRRNDPQLVLHVQSVEPIEANES